MGVLHFHDSVVRPELVRRQRPVIVEIGIQKGIHFRKLLLPSFLKRGRLIGIDPEPHPKLKRLVRWLPHAELVAATSLDALPKLIERGVCADIVIVDGDHNYYTVSRELELIERILSKDGVVLLHDVGWPYGRRDLYYAPERIPEFDRQPYAKRGIVKGQSQLAETGGKNAHLFNALYEGGPKNGVRTAVEDFVAARGQAWQLEVREEEFGLGILRRRTAEFGSP